MSLFIPLQGDCREKLRGLDDESVSAIATDPPYGIGYMNRKWDTFKPGTETERIVTRMLGDDNPNLKGRKRSPASSPSAVEYDRSLSGQREFQAWCTSWGVEALRVMRPGAHMVVCGAPRSYHRMVAGLEDAGFELRDGLIWLFAKGSPKSLNLGDGIGTGLKPSWEPIALFRKPLEKLTLKECMRIYGTGGLSIEGCAIPREDGEETKLVLKNGRWPANVTTDEGVSTLLGLSSRYFYSAKVSTAEREFGCEHLPARTAGEMTGGRKAGSKGLRHQRAGAGRLDGAHNAHPTVKPIALMRWLIRLVVPTPESLVVDPFVGSGSTAIAACLEGHECVGMDLEKEWLRVAEARVKAWMKREGKL